jgi:hypothetical protein
MPFISSNPIQKSAIAGLTLLVLAGVCTAGLSAREEATHSAAGAVSSSLPLSFEPNRGQSEDGVQFVARGPGYAVYLSEDGLSFRFSSASEISGGTKPSLAIRLAGQKRSKAHMLGMDERPSKSSYYSGSDPKKWVTDIPNFSRVERRGVYEGIDASYRGSQGQLECEFRIAPHANPGIIALEIIGARNLRLSAEGDIVFTVADVEMQFSRPAAYQEVNGARHGIASSYRMKGNFISIAVGTYDPRKTLVVNPVLSYSGFLKLQDANSVPAALPDPARSFAIELDSSVRSKNYLSVAIQKSFTKYIQEQYASSHSH